MNESGNDLRFDIGITTCGGGRGYPCVPPNGVRLEPTDDAISESGAKPGQATLILVYWSRCDVGDCDRVPFDELALEFDDVVLDVAVHGEPLTNQLGVLGLSVRPLP